MKEESTFIRLATSRVTALKKTGRLIKNLATYPHTPEHAQQIVDAVNELADDIAKSFEVVGVTKAERDAFRLVG
jgi:alkanesulfonate monooxygenase SsuD/methylene tetrahydromethanopterin reductase-like flavin-dependent oxidoreductase (luciferase family)